jgi:tetratricopeptide (TPR) repeat protein
VTAAVALLLFGASVDVETLRENLARVDRSIEETETLLARTPTARYVPELRFRLCELVVEKSRVLYGLKAAEQPENLGPIVSPEVRLLKEKAVGMYSRMLREFPKYEGNDKVRFYLAHEQRELGHFDEMVETLETLAKKHHKSPLAQEAELILGDHFFDKNDNDEAEKHYKSVLRKAATPAHDLARYKLGWIEVNRGNHDKAIVYFEAVVTGRQKAASRITEKEGRSLDKGGEVAAEPESKKILDVRREALVDLVYSYTEVKKPAGALSYFERLSDSAATYALVLDKLANRYLVKTQPENAVPAFRRLLSLRADPERDEDRALALYDAIKDTAGKVPPTAQDVSFLVRAAVQVRKSISMLPDERKEKLGALEQCARDLSTRLHLAAQKKDDKRLFIEASAAYAEYLTLFRPEKYVRDVMKNRADSLYAAHQYTEAAGQFEQLAKATDGSDLKLNEEATYGALVAWRASVADDRLEHLSRFQIVDARQALKRVGTLFVKRFPRNESVPEVRFNIARAHFDDGEYKQASEKFLAFALQYPDHKDAAIAGHLALDSTYKTHDYKRFADVGNQLIASRLPDSFKSEAKKVLQGVEGEALTEMALASAEKTGDVVKGLEQIAKDSKDSGVAVKALQGAMLAAREKGDWSKEVELAGKLMDQFPDAKESDDLELQLARRAIDTARFGEAAGWFEKASEVLEGKKAQDALRSAANLYLAMGEMDRGSKVMENIASKVSKAEKSELYAELAEDWLQAGDPKRAEGYAKKAFSADSNSPRAAAVLAQAGSSSADGAAETLAIAEGEPAARGMWHATEGDFDAFYAMEANKLEQKVAAWSPLEQTYAQIIGQGSPEYTVAALWRMGLAYQDLAETLLEVPVPKDVDKAEFKAAAEEQAAPLKERAEQTFSICVQKADEQGVFTEAAVGCRNKTDDVKIASFKVKPRTDKISVPPEVQRKVDLQKDAGALSSVATQWLAAGNPAMARLVFARALEVNKSLVQAQTGLGYSLLQLGEPMAAGAAYREALNMEPANALAHGNLAALKCRFGDQAGARAELEQVSDKSQLNGPAADPAWKPCVEAYSRR